MSAIETTSVKWPAFIKPGHCDELEYVASAEQWQAHYVSGKYLPDDKLIDSAGRCFSIGTSDADFVLLSLEELLELVRLHASVCGHCCVSKMGAPDVAAAVELVGGIE